MRGWRRAQQDISWRHGSREGSLLAAQKQAPTARLEAEEGLFTPGIAATFMSLQPPCLYLPVREN